MENVKKSSKMIFLDKNLRFLRKSKNWSQEELANKLGLNRGNIASYEKGTAEPKICNLLKIAHVFGVSILDLTGKNLREEGISFVDYSPTGGGTAVIELEKLGHYVQQVKELETVIESIHNCHCFKLKQMEELPKDIQAIVTHFEQLYDVTQALMHSHKEILQTLDPVQLQPSSNNGSIQA